MPTKLSEGLLNNGISSLEEGLIKLNDSLNGNHKALKFSILSISHYIELSFKYFISTIHPLLIYKNPFSERIDKSNTISLWEAVNFFINSNALQAISTEEDEKLKINIKYLKDIRNSIEHFEYELDVFAAQITIGKILSILNNSYQLRGIDIARRMPPYVRALYSDTINEYEYKLGVARQAAKIEAERYQINFAGEPNDYSKEEIVKVCSCCQEATLVYEETTTLYQCTFCQHLTRAVRCTCCQKLISIGEILPTLRDNIYVCSQQCLEEMLKGEKIC